MANSTDEIGLKIFPPSFSNLRSYSSEITVKGHRGIRPGHLFSLGKDAWGRDLMGTVVSVSESSDSPTAQIDLRISTYPGRQEEVVYGEVVQEAKEEHAVPDPLSTKDSQLFWDSAIARLGGG